VGFKNDPTKRYGTTAKILVAATTASFTDGFSLSASDIRYTTCEDTKANATNATKLSNFLAPVCCATKWSEKVAQLCCVSDIGLSMPSVSDVMP